MTSPTPEALEAQLAKQRAELAATIDQLSFRLDPRTKANEAVAFGKQLVHDAGTDPETTPEDRGRARTYLGIGAAAVAGLVAAVIARRH
ncbi:DUF3618 domain-containing protein [Pengzhenrongella sicca]|uniref:DUF3618 domain-containing protein n=1 Tax=Pengzhenrongella sicca TaxID=2819238 RepID=A0A8A4ZGM1_9MICO|nr:DUF3618 domain-containing protein [Pengzhenrongella sicca]QTE29676.1 DUF3618 domain-containing protein [Pengzhenrongella sicca]